ncbi:MAG: metalloregulator ArsR/SmtB family transcription factor [Planctomycetota bacterium]
MTNADIDGAQYLAWINALGDLARLRMMRLLVLEELSVGELSRALQLPQSTVSRHLKLLHERSWLSKRTAGTASLYKLLPDTLPDGARELWQVTESQIGDSSSFESDDARLVEVLAERSVDSKTYFGRLGGEWNDVRTALFGHEFTHEALLGLLNRNWTIADLGCGTGNAAALLAPYVKKLIAIDREPAMLEAASRRLTDVDNVEFRAGDLTMPPLEPGEVDVAMVFLVMHHVQDPMVAVQAIARCLAPAGVLMIVDMVAHDREAYRSGMGHVHLGFDEETVQSWGDAASLKRVDYRRLRPDTSGQGPGLFAAYLSNS